MAATALVPVQITRAGAVDTLSAANVDGHTIANPQEKCWIEVNNGSGASINVTLDIITTVDGQPVTDRVVAVAAGARKKIGPFPIVNYGDNVTVTFSAVTTVTVGAFTL